MPIDRRLLLAAAATAPLLGRRPADAAAPFLNAPAPAYYRFRHGAFEITVVSDGPIALPTLQSVLTDAPRADLERLLTAARLPTDRWTGPQNMLVVNTGRNLVLIDTGMGDRSRIFGPASGRLIANLRAAGIDPAQVDTVLLTHAHIDHAWGLVDAQDRLNFPNARLMIAQSDWDFWTQESLLRDAAARPFVEFTRTNLLPYRDRVTWVRDGAEAVPGITAMATHGHTVGHMSYVIESEGRRLINVGDIVHHPLLLLRHPEWKVGFDSDPEAGARTRRRVLEQAAADGTLMAFFHFPFPGHGTVARDGNAFVWLPAPLHETI